MSKHRKILVTKSYLPPLKDYVKYLEKIWNSHQLTNNGPLVRKLEEELKKYLGVKHLYFVSNGTMGLQLAIKSLNLTKEIITTPFTYVATANSIIWEGCKPVFVDIDPTNLAIDPEKIEKAITKNTQAILAVHIFGYPCQVEKIDEIAKKHNLKVIYDAAHAFGTNVNGKSVLNYGNISVLSFHATKLFHTAEGGALITNDDNIAEKIKLYRSFGQPDWDYISVGVNAKNSEFHAALGLCNLNAINTIIEKRKRVTGSYNELLNSKNIKNLTSNDNVNYNYAYYPIIFKSEKKLLKAKRLLEDRNIYPRRYFYPSLNTLPFVDGSSCPISESISKRILCLPLYDSLSKNEAKEICAIVNESFANSSNKKINKVPRDGYSVGFSTIFHN